MAAALTDRRVCIALVDAQQLWVEFETGCVGCTGCGGACGLARGRRVALPRALLDFPASVGDPVILRLGAGGLGREAARGYGLALVGLLGGALLAGLAFATWLPERDPNGGVLIGAVLGTLLALYASKRPTVRIVRAEA